MQLVKDRSCGIIPIRRKECKIELLLVQHIGGHWSFPKGHPENAESDQEAAKRELHEETGLLVESFLDLPPFEEKYCFYHKQQKIHKTVLYFPAFVKGSEQKQEEEILDLLWCDFQACYSQLTFKQSKDFCIQLQDQLALYIW